MALRITGAGESRGEAGTQDGGFIEVQNIDHPAIAFASPAHRGPRSQAALFKQTSKPRKKGGRYFLIVLNEQSKENQDSQEKPWGKWPCSVTLKSPMWELASWQAPRPPESSQTDFCGLMLSSNWTLIMRKACDNNKREISTLTNRKKQMILEEIVNAQFRKTLF